MRYELPKYRRIRELREDHDLRQKDLARFLNISQNTYSRYEIGERNIPAEIIVRIADYYNTSTDYLLGRTDNPSPPHGRV